ncbi:MAG: hypothetical protein AAB795_03620 [Patescibacteria group bacterium]
MITSEKITSAFFIIICVAILTIAPIFYAYFLEQRAINTLKTSTINSAITGDIASRIIKEVARAEKIPKNETPTVVLVTDPTTLTPFGQIMPGDYILLYHQSNLAVVYDEISERIINAVPVNIKNPNAK